MISIDTAQSTIMCGSEQVRLACDTELLRSFVAEQSDSAFAELMRRHGPMVMDVCRRALPECHDAEDAYQTTFLLLVQKSASIRNPERLANWLFGVAYRVSGRIRTRASKQQSLRMRLRGAAVEDTDVAVEIAWREARSVLDEELHRLPARYRLPLILCYLEGKSHVEAARQLGWPSGSMSSRLARSREKLRWRLARRGLTFTSALFAMLLREKASGQELSLELIQHTKRAAMASASGKPLLPDVVSASVAELLEEMNQRMFVAKVRDAAVLVLLALLLLGTAGNAVRVVRSELKERAVRRGAAIPPPFAWTVPAGPSAVVSLTRPPSAARADVRETVTAAAPNASPSACSQK
jgi:RNA polymerase sigma factor (sigma-70 family)